ANRFIMIDGELYRRTTEGPLLKCLGPEKTKYVLREIHEGSCGNYSRGRSLAQNVTRQGYFWPTLVKDAQEFVKKSVEYFSKCVEAETLAKISEKEANRQTKVSTRILLQHLKTRLNGAKGLWVEELPGVLWAYRTTPRTTTGDTPFCLVYGLEAVIPAEIGEEKTRVAQCNPVENEKARNFDLVTIEQIRDIAYVKILHYKGLMMKSYNNRVKLRNFQVGDLVLKEVDVSKHVRKLDPSWEGSYKVIEVKKKGTYQLQDMEGKELPRLWNVHNIRKFYA
ncbi:hypothetical protein Sango_2307000, partial [Sesamum angolense]